MKIIGRVTAFEPVIPLTLSRPDGSFFTVNVVVDTGYTDFLTLPLFIFEQVASGPIDQSEVTFADDRSGMHDMATVTILWDGEPKQVSALKIKSDPLVGMSLLEGHRITIDDTEGGRVHIEPLSTDNAS